MKTLIIILAISVFAAIAFVYTKNSAKSAKPNASLQNTPKDFPPKPKWKPGIPVDLERIANTFKYYSDNKIVFAIFEHGTCVPVSKESEQPEQEALAILHALFIQHPDFDPRHMDDGNWMTSHSGKAYSICFNDEIEANWDTIDNNHMDAIATDEVLLNSDQQPNVFNRTVKIGLFARARWFMDCQNPIIVKIVKPASSIE